VDNPQRGEHTIKDRDGVEWKLALRNNEICAIEKLLGIDDLEETIYGNDEKGIKALNSTTGWRAILFAVCQRHEKKRIVTLDDAGDLGDKINAADLHIAVHCMLMGITRAEYDIKIAELIAKKKAEGEATSSPPEQAATAQSASEAPALS
jgi:hypothetical protein